MLPYDTVEVESSVLGSIDAVSPVRVSSLRRLDVMLTETVSEAPEAVPV